MTYFLEFLKTKKTKQNRDKRLNLLNKKDDSLQLYLSSRIQAAYNFVYDK